MRSPHCRHINAYQWDALFRTKLLRAMGAIPGELTLLNEMASTMLRNTSPEFVHNMIGDSSVLDRLLKTYKLKRISVYEDKWNEFCCRHSDDKPYVQRELHQILCTCTGSPVIQSSLIPVWST
jgi:hypothetical protein